MHGTIPLNGRQSGYRLRIAVVLAWWLVVVIAGAADARKLFTNSLAPMPDHVTRSLKPLQASHLGQMMEVEIALQMRDYPKLVDRIGRGHVLTRAELEQNHLPTAADYTALVQWLRGEGFVITREDPSRLAVFVRGSVARIQQSLQVSMQHVTVDGEDHNVAVTHPSLPMPVAAAVLGVNGLQPYAKMRKRSTSSPNAPPYLVSEMLGAYDAKNLGVTGAGQKIAILIDTVPLNSDLTSFWTNNGISQSLSNIETVNVKGGTLPATSGEETLDVEWTSGVAPGAKVRVYAAGSLAFTDLDKALQQIIADLPSQPQLHQMSISLGLGETYTGSSQMQTDAQYFATLASGGVSVFVSSGDAGSNPNSSGGTGGPLQVEYYSSDPSVTGVGGTSLTLNTSTGQISTETAWSGSGGGASVTFSRPSWQTGTGVPTGTTRLVPDVCAAADPNTGAYVYLNGTVRQIGGTSWSAPMWAGFCALINESRAKASKGPIGLLNPYLYPLIGTGNFRDITSGSNGSYSAGTGYDRVTGIGSPNVTMLMQTLTAQGVAFPSIAGFAPTSGTVGTSVIVTGANFIGATAVKFNGVSTALFSVDSDTQVTAVVPTGASTGTISITNPGGTGASSASFTVQPSNIPNDAFASAQAITGTTGSITGTNVGATKESGEPNHAGNAGGDSVWFAWTAPVSGIFDFNTQGSSFDTLLAVYTGGSVSALTSVASNDDTSAATTSAVSFSATAGITYMIAVDGHDGAFGAINLSWTQNTAPPSIAGFAPGVGSAGSTIAITGSNFIGTSSVKFNGASAAFSIISATQINAVVPAGATSGTISVATPNGTATSPSSFTVVFAPANDSFANAFTISGNYATVIGGNLGGTKESGEPDHAGNTGGASVWWTWTAPSTGQYTLSTQGSSFDTLLAIYTGTGVGALTSVASNDNDPAGGSTSFVTLNATAGTTYKIAVDGAVGQVGSIVLTLNPSSTTATLYSTGFETADGFPFAGTLAGSNGWTKTGSGGNGFRNASAFTGLGRQGYVGRTAPTSPDTSLSVWTPLNYTAAAGDVVTFSVLSDIVDSSNGHYDFFRWEFWNLSGQRLFAFQFDNATNELGYFLDDGQAVHAISQTLTNSHVYAMLFTLDFSNNTWSLTLDGATVISNQPITTTGAQMSLGGIRANWTLQSSTAGSNYMAFDSYRITRNSSVAPVIGTSPQSQTLTTGNPVLLTVSAYGTMPLSYQWRKGGVVIPGAVSQSYPIAAAQTSDSGSYDVVVTNIAGSATSGAASIVVNVPTAAVSLTALPLNGGSVAGSGTFNIGSNVTVTATPASGYTFGSWTENGTVVSTSAAYSFTASADRALVANFVAQPITTWKAGHFSAAELGNPAVSGDLADPDQDSIPNLMEYALNLDPRTSDAAQLPHATVENNALTLTYTVNKSATDVTLSIEVSGDLATWNSGTGFTSKPVLLNDDGVTQTYKVSDLTQLAPGVQRFIRLRVSKP